MTKTRFTRLSLIIGATVGLFPSVAALAGSQVVEGGAGPGSAGSFDGPTSVQPNRVIDTSDYGRVLDRSNDGIRPGNAPDVGISATTFADMPIEGVRTVDFVTSDEEILSANIIATNVSTEVLSLSAVTITLEDRSISIAPDLSKTIVTVTDDSNTVTREFAGEPTQVSQPVGTVAALIAADVHPDATEAGASIASVGVAASSVVNLILGYEQIGGDFLTANNPSAPEHQVPVLIASAELSDGLLNQNSSIEQNMIAQQARVNPWELNAVIAAYNQVIMECPPEALDQLASNPTFQAIGEELRQLKASL